MWYRVTVWEERVEHRTVTDSNGHTRHEKHHYWHQICQEEAMSDFYIQDGYTKVFIKGSQRYDERTVLSHFGFWILKF